MCCTQNIFIGEDIRKQLPQESADFDGVNAIWKKTMTRLNQDPNALRGTHEEGILDRLNKMNTKLEEIQKSLDMYLEVKRQIFPRFYFLSNDDLLEILGQSRNPEAVGCVYHTHCTHVCMYNMYVPTSVIQTLMHTTVCMSMLQLVHTVHMYCMYVCAYCIDVYTYSTIYTFVWCVTVHTVCSTGIRTCIRTYV